MDLDVKRKAIAFQPLDQVKFPKRAAGVKRVAVEPRYHDAELAFTARFR